VGGAVVGTLVGADSDTGDQLFFALVPSSVSHLFRINSSTTSVSLTTAGDIDYEGAAQDFRISLRVFDRDPSGLDLGAALCADVAIALLVLDANDHAPAFTRTVYTASFPEDAAIGFNTNAMRVTAADSDSGLNGRVRPRRPNNPRSPSHPHALGTLLLLLLGWVYFLFGGCCYLARGRGSLLLLVHLFTPAPLPTGCRGPHFKKKERVRTAPSVVACSPMFAP
jgi:hypothetical protein